MSRGTAKPSRRPRASRTYGVIGPSFPRLGRAVYGSARMALTSLFARHRMYGFASAYARERSAAMQETLRRGETVHLLGIGPSGHDAAAALVEVSSAGGVRLICNEEEERYTGIKHDSAFPEHALEVVKARLAERRLLPQDLHAVLASWCYPDFLASSLQAGAEHFPASLGLFHPAAARDFNHRHAWRARKAPQRLGRQLGLAGPMPIIGMSHHANHAYFSYAVSPFHQSKDPVMVTVLDGYGDDGAISLFLVKDGVMQRLRTNRSVVDSLGVLYSILSSTQGGWTILSSEGRYMGAAAWGDNDRLTNPYYRRLRQLAYFDEDGQVFLNRRMINWHRAGERKPYGAELARVLGEPVPQEALWNPDRVLTVDDVQHAPVTQERVDKAAATQLLFEDILFHIVDHLIRLTGSERLVLSGGTALNCVANLRLMEHFDERYYARVLGRSARLHLWVPPVPGDAGAAAGAAYHFALASGASPGDTLRHAFYCGSPAPSAGIRGAIEATAEIACRTLGNVGSSGPRARVADLVAYIVAHDGVLGLFQGAAETGPRALGHRSILANPCNPSTLDLINQRVKLRERIRPLAPMATYEAAQRYFELSPGASDDEHNAYNYMVLTARARPESRAILPAVIHHDGTSRVQIVREDLDPFCHAYLKAMGRRVGAEVSVNTSLNIGSPIVQTPAQALEALKRSRGLTGLVMISAEQDAFLVWHDVELLPKDAGRALIGLVAEWEHETSGMLARSTPS